jgi:signal transduction histidine kinase
MSSARQELRPLHAIPVETRLSLTNALSRRGSGLFLVLVIAVVIAVGTWVIRDVRTANAEAQQIYAGSVIGLRRIGAIQYEAQETRRSTLYALTTNDANLQLDYADQSRDADRKVTEGITRYLQEKRGQEELGVGRLLAQDWNSYLKVRDEVLGLILEGDIKKAVGLDLKEGVMSFDRVRRDLEDINRLYDERASQELSSMAGSSHRSVAKLIAVLAFVLLFSTVSVWAIQRSEALAALHMAKLQMDFVASVSHDLRTPLTAILTAGQTMKDGFVPDIPLYGSIITTQALQLIDLVDQVVLFASMKDDKRQYSLRPVSVSELFDHVRGSTEWMLEQKGLVIDFSSEEQLPFVVGDLEALSRCLLNLVGNAVKYSEPGKAVRVAAQLFQPAGSAPEIRISVTDQGMGIAPDELEHIFEPFYRSPRVRAAQIRGTGLGLSVARQLAEVMGGRVSVASKVGAGSVFTLQLQVAEVSRPLEAVRGELRGKA